MHKYPGLGLPFKEITYEKDHYPTDISLDHSDYWSMLIYVRELAMMDVMEKLTDKPNWHKKVFDDEIVAKWRREALAISDEILYRLATSGKHQTWGEGEDGGPTFEDSEVEQKPDNVLNERAFDCCIDELRSKARYFEKTNIIPTLDATASIAKSDSLITREVHDDLCAAFERLKSDQAISPDWHPNSNGMVQDLVHPSMYPLVYGRSRVFQEECVGVEDAVESWAGKGTILHRNNGDEEESAGRFWSQKYQWLPANLSFESNGTVRFTSYINNLHPKRYPEIYRAIEKLVEAALPMWDQCLAFSFNRGDIECAGRSKPRMDLVEDPNDDNPKNWNPDNFEACENIDVTKEELDDLYYSSDEDAENINEFKWRVIRKPVFPEPTFEEAEYTPKEGSRLRERFAKSGLQLIVKMASIELTPEKPDFPPGGWHVEGLMNERICATALYYLDCENVTSSNLSFRMATSPHTNTEMGDREFPIDQDQYHWMESVFGTPLQSNLSPCIQNYGSVDTRQGRLLAFPNVFQHRVSPFRLIDPTKPGYRRFIALWLVDPTQRIINTANVPPQQMTWYLDSLLGNTPGNRREALAKLPTELVALLQEKTLETLKLDNYDDEESIKNGAKLPEELMEMVRDYFDAEEQTMPMGVEEAIYHRAQLMRERSATDKHKSGYSGNTGYNFCEH